MSFFSILQMVKFQIEKFVRGYFFEGWDMRYFFSHCYYLGVIFIFGWLMGWGCSENKRCIKSTDCGRSEICINQKCQKRTGKPCVASQEHIQCSAGERCVDGLCLITKKNPNEGCSEDLDCPYNQRCDTIREKCVDCLQNKDCPNGQICLDWYCISGDAGIPENNVDIVFVGCRSDADCDLHSKCDLNEFRCKTTSGQCVTDNECKGGLHCEKEHCKLGRRECGTPFLQCHPKFVCAYDRFCYRFPCLSKIDCPYDQFCDTKTGKCEKNDPNDCVISACPKGQICNTKTHKCHVENATKCLQDSDCLPPNGTCYKGFCRSCDDAFSCPSNKKCEISSGLCIKPTAQCRANIDCKPPAGTCRNGMCRSCASQFSCTVGKCDFPSGRCIEPPCKKNLDCKPPTGTCNQGKCETCTTDFLCKLGNICDVDLGRCVPRCNKNSDCRDPYGTCRNGLCQSCAKHFKCDIGQRCQSFSGRCFPNP